MQLTTYLTPLQHRQGWIQALSRGKDLPLHSGISARVTNAKVLVLFVMRIDAAAELIDAVCWGLARSCRGEHNATCYSAANKHAKTSRN